MRWVYRTTVAKKQWIWQANRKKASNRTKTEQLKQNALSQTKMPVKFEDQAMGEPTLSNMKGVCGIPAAEGKLIRFAIQKNVSDRTKSEQLKWSILLQAKMPVTYEDYAVDEFTLAATRQVYGVPVAKGQLTICVNEEMADDSEGEEAEDELKKRDLFYRRTKIIEPAIDYITSKEIDSDDDSEGRETETTELEEKELNSLAAARWVYGIPVVKEQSIRGTNKEKVSVGTSSQAQMPVKFEDCVTRESIFAETRWVCGATVAKRQWIQYDPNSEKGCSYCKRMGYLDFKHDKKQCMRNKAVAPHKVLFRTSQDGTDLDNDDQDEDEHEGRMKIFVPAVDYIPPREIDSDDDSKEGKAETTELEKEK
jgi:hypothetical protein